MTGKDELAGMAGNENTGFRVPLIVRGRIIEDYDAAFGGRRGGARFETANEGRNLDQLIAPSDCMAAYQDLSIDEIARFRDELSRMLHLDRNRAFREAYELSCKTSGIADSVLEFLYRSAPARVFARDNVLEFAERRIGRGYLEGWVETPMRDRTVTAIRAFGARAVHIIAGNTPAVAFGTVLRSAVTRSDSIVKTPSNDPLTMAALLQAMIALDADHLVTRHMSCAYWKGGDETIERRLYRPANIDKIVAWGGFDSIRHVTRYLQPGLDLITLDPKHSGSIIGKEALESDEVMREVAMRAAVDVGVYNQEACANARVLYVECDSGDPAALDRLNQFGELMFAALAQLPQNLSTRAKYVSAPLNAELDSLFMLEDWYRLYRGDDHGGAVIVSQTDEPVPFAAELACRTANIVPVPNIDAALRRVNAATQTIGVWPPELKRAIRDRLALRGGQMIVELGYVARMNGNGPLDGIEAERRLLKWVVDQVPSRAIPGPWVAPAAGP